MTVYILQPLTCLLDISCLKDKGTTYETTGALKDKGTTYETTGAQMGSNAFFGQNNYPRRTIMLEK